MVPMQFARPWHRPATRVARRLAACNALLEQPDQRLDVCGFAQVLVEVALAAQLGQPYHVATQATSRALTLRGARAAWPVGRATPHVPVKIAGLATGRQSAEPRKPMNEENDAPEAGWPEQDLHAAALAAAAYLRRHGLVVVTAESCTAGLIAATLAEVPGAGQVLEAAFVVYDPKAKRRSLGVPQEVLDQNNLTSEPVARAMAQGALERSSAGLAVANTGVADDCDGAVPAGTQCFAWLFHHAGEVHGFTETCRFTGDRNGVRAAAAGHALARIAHYHGRLP